jgi:hypothetical protein
MQWSVFDDAIHLLLVAINLTGIELAFNKQKSSSEFVFLKCGMMCRSLHMLSKPMFIKQALHLTFVLQKLKYFVYN